MKKHTLANFNTYLVVALVIILAVSLYFTLSVPITKKEAAKVIPPREITLTVLGSDCEDCFNISTAIDFLKQQKDINITEVKEISIEESTEMVGKYNITRLPALLITGNISNLTIPNFDAKEDALMFDKAPAPYYDVAEKRVKGKVTLVMLEDKSCKECFNMSLIVDQLKQVGIKMTSEQTIEADSIEGKGLIDKYKIERIPTLIFNKEALEYEVVKQVWEQVGTEESDGKLVLRLVNPPYVNVSTGKTEGLVDITYLIDESCEECYNGSVFGELMEGSFNLYFKKHESLDVTSTKGKVLVKKYNITLVPTAVLSKEANAYPNFAKSWEQVGTREKDGMFVFRKISLLEGFFEQTGEKLVYKDLSTGELVGAGNSSVSIEEPEIEPPSEES